mmetsp:Transcript_11362/g.27864  ORF Transcript_11362/g.27864 Transcript_11362/m.27864 type:complete len:357 (+) Transcript_11362:357-1427(+)
MPGAEENGHAVTDCDRGEEISFLKHSFDGIAEDAADCHTNSIRTRAPLGQGGGTNGSTRSLDQMCLEAELAATGDSSIDEGQPQPRNGSRTKSSGTADDKESYVPPRLTRMRSSSLPDLTKTVASPERPGAAASEKSERVAHMRKALAARGFSEQAQVLSDAYITTVLLAHKNGKQRTFDYALDKLAESLQWRRDYGAAALTAHDVAQPLAPGHMYWRGRDPEGRPILWVRPALMDLATYDRDLYLKAHVYLLERGLELMTGDVTCFVLVADSTGLSQKHMDAKLMRELLKVAQVAYPDRLGALVVGPVNMIVRGAWVLLSRLMSTRLAEKINLVQSPRAHLSSLLPAEEIPEWLA